jgi:putative zinc finger protein
MTQPEHPAAEQISSLLAEVLPSAEAMEVNAHLASCAACSAERDALLDLTALLAEEGGALPWEMPSDLAASLDTALARASAERAAGIASIDLARTSAGRQPWKWLAGAAAAVAIVGLGVAGLRALPDQPASHNAGPASNAAAGRHATYAQGQSPDGDSIATGLPSAGGSAPPGPSSPQVAPAINSTAEVPEIARRLSQDPAEAMSPRAAGCAVPLTGGAATLVRFKGHPAILTIAPDTRLVTIYDCATATKTLFLTGY